MPRVGALLSAALSDKTLIVGVSRDLSPVSCHSVVLGVL